MTKELIERTAAEIAADLCIEVDCFPEPTMLEQEAAKLLLSQAGRIESLQARVAEFTKLDSGRCTTINSLTVENAQLERARDALAAELASIKAQEPVAWTSASWLSNPHAGHFSANKTGCFNVPLFAAPTSPVREPLENAVKTLTAEFAASGSEYCQYALGDGYVVKVMTAEAHNAQTVREPIKIPQGYALVPIRTTRAMEEVFEEEGWEWANLLAAAEAITLEEYEEATSEPVREPLTDDQCRDIYNAAMELPNRSAVSVMRYIESKIKEQK